MELFPIKTISESALQSNDHSSDSIRDDLKAFLKTQKEIRILVANSSGYGNQSGSVNILRQLIDGGWNDGNKKGTLYVLALYYANVTERMEQIGKMQVLIPQFKNLDEVFELNEAPVKVVELGPGTQLQPQTLFGITGGWDDKERPTEKVLEQLNVTTYLQLQVYAWTQLGSNQVWFKTEKKTWEKNNLDETEPNPYLARRTLYLNDPLITPSDWSSLFTSGFKNQAKIVQYLLSNE